MIRVGRKRDARRLLIKNLLTSLVTYESLVTSAAKARMVQGHFDRLIRLAATGDPLNARRNLSRFLLTKTAVHKVLAELAPRYRGKTSGLSRILLAGRRVGDGSQQAILQLVDTVRLTPPAPKNADTANQSKKPARKTDNG